MTDKGNHSLYGLMNMNTTNKERKTGANTSATAPQDFEHWQEQR